MKSALKYSILGVVLLVIFTGIGIATDLIKLEYKGFIKVKEENITREAYEETKSYNESKEQDLLKYRLEYLQAETDDEREALAFTIRHIFADYDESKLSPELRDFLKKIKYGE